VHFAVSDFILDLLQNSVEAGASLIQLSVVAKNGTLSCSIGDNGKGMDEKTLARVRDPFFTDGVKHKRRKVGLGIPFLLQAVEQAGGASSLSSTVGVGTLLEFSFPADHVDTPPLGDLAGTVLQAMCFDSGYELVFSRVDEPRGLSYEISRSELRAAVGDFTDAGAYALAREFLESQES